MTKKKVVSIFEFILHTQKKTRGDKEKSMINSQLWGIAGKKNRLLSLKVYPHYWKVLMPIEHTNLQRNSTINLSQCTAKTYTYDYGWFQT